jgi:nucleoside-diphosphate-sugar epimerase
MEKIILLGGAGLVGQNLVVRLRIHGYEDIVVLDKHRANLAILGEVQPGVTAEYADLSCAGNWQRHFKDADVVVMLQAQIGGTDRYAFVRNNVDSTRLIIEEIKKNNIAYAVHVSSSVVKSVANDFYSDTKREQERMVLESGIGCTILRPTLMFGWFDRKHLGWLRRFMDRSPVFPIPGNGKFTRQPLFVGDFVSIIIASIEQRKTGTFDISGLEQISYGDLIAMIHDIVKARAWIVHIPYSMFWALLWLYACIDKNPPFTTGQLEALVIPETFPIIDWPKEFGIAATPLRRALEDTYLDSRFAPITLSF